MAKLLNSRKRGKGKAAAPPETGDPETAVAGPGRNPATNLILTDIALRAGMRLGRRYIERGLLRRHFSRRQAKQIIKGRPLSMSIASIVLTRVATRSVPGAILIGGGIIAKLLYDRTKSTRQAEAEGRADLAEQAENA